jgi:hypothetical protein
VPVAIPTAGSGASCSAPLAGAYVLGTHDTLLHGNRVSAECLVRGIACLAEGLGIHGTARVFEVDPNPVLQRFVEAADQLQAFLGHCLCDMHVREVQLDELYAVLSNVKNGAVSEDDAIEHLSRSPPWVWVAIDPLTKAGLL